MKRDIQEILNRVDNLPFNFHIAVKVSKMLDDYDVGINELAEVISADEALTVKLLKTCNSAGYGFSKKITTVKEAVARIGFKPLKTMVFTIVSKSSFSGEVRGYGLEQGELWKNSIACAVYSRYLAELLSYADLDQAFTAGLLRDIGKLILHEYVREDYDTIVKIVNTEQVSFSSAEERVIGLNHSQIGGIVAEKWKFPEVLADVVKYHHNPAEADKACNEDPVLVKIVHLADHLTFMLGNGVGMDGMMYNIDTDTVAGLGFDPTPQNMELLICDMVNLGTEIDSLISSFD